MGEHKWTHQTASKISTILRKQLGIKISASLVHQLLGDLGYSLKSNLVGSESFDSPPPNRTARTGQVSRSSISD